MVIEYSRILKETTESLKRKDFYGKDKYTRFLLANLYVNPKENRSTEELLSILQCQTLYNYVELSKIKGCMISASIFTDGCDKDYGEINEGANIVEYFLEGENKLKRLLPITIWMAQKKDNLHISEIGNFASKCYSINDDDNCIVYAYLSTLIACLLRGLPQGKALYIADGSIENNFKNHSNARRVLELMDKVCDLDANEVNDKKIFKLASKQTLEHSLAVAIYTSFRSIEEENSFNFALNLASKHSKEAVIITAVILGAILGAEEIPKDLISNVREEEIYKIADRLHINKLDIEV